MPDPSAAWDSVRSVGLSFASATGAALLAVQVIVVIVTLVDGSVVAGAEDDAIDGLVLLVPVLIVASPEGAEALVLSTKLVLGAEIEATSNPATSVSGSILGARRSPKSCGRVPSLTFAPP